MEKRKNVLLISVDHWFASLLGVAGHKTIMTPTLDKLASNGIRYENMYSECPVCIPARRTLMTGVSPKTHGDRVYNDTLEMPEVKTLAQTFVDSGYQAYAVGKLHVYPQRNRIGFNDALISEEGRYGFGIIDDYQIWLGENGYIGQEFSHGMGNNTYQTRPWHLDEKAHPTNWATREMMKIISRKDPTKPAFYYISYQFPHPPLVPLQSYLDMYDLNDLDDEIESDWSNIDNYIMNTLTEAGKEYTVKEKKLARRAFYAQCTHIDHQIRLLIGTLRESNLLDNTIVAFFSDHGDMLFDHNMVAKRVFYENSTNIPLIITGNPISQIGGVVDTRLGVLADVMPTLLDLCDIPIPETVEGKSLVSSYKREMIYGEIGEGSKATRMVRNDRYKLIYYPMGNIIQLFDMKIDRLEKNDLSNNPDLEEAKNTLIKYLIKNLYNGDEKWVMDGKLVGYQEENFEMKKDYGLYNQRGIHWPTPSGYSNLGKNS